MDDKYYYLQNDKTSEHDVLRLNPFNKIVIESNQVKLQLKTRIMIKRK